MAKLSEMSLPELYDRKVTSTVEKVILIKEDFSNKVPNWCEKVCKLNCKSPPLRMFDRGEIDVLIIQDYSAFDEPSFFKRGGVIEKKHEDIIEFLAKRTLGYKDETGKPVPYSFDITNLVKCQISGTDIKRGKPPTDTVLAKCRPYLFEEIRTRKPKVIISLSTAATKALGFKASNARDCGDILSYEGIPVVITLHPRVLLMLRQNASGAAWGPDFYSMIEKDFQKSAAILRKDNPLRVPNLDAAIERAKEHIFVARTIEQVKEFCEILTREGLNKKIESFDTETTGLDPFAADAKIILMQFGVRNSITGNVDAYVFPMWHRNNVWYNPDEAWECIKPILLNPEVKKVGHNMKFDMMYVEITLGIRIQGVLYDTMLLLHSINSGLQGTYGLKRAVGNWLPDSELQGYEDKLPKLTRIKKGIEDGTDRDEEETEGEESGCGDAH